MNPLDYSPAEQAKAIGPAVAAVIMFVIAGMTTGDWTETDTIVTALGTIITYATAFCVPNRG